MKAPVKIAYRPDAAIWMWGFGPQATAVISKEMPADDSKARPLAAILAHIDDEAWEWVPVEEAKKAAGV